MPETTRYRVSIPAPNTHEVEVEAVFPGLPAGRHDLKLPVWAPGSYLVRDFARHVSAVEVRDGRGRKLAVSKTGKSTWRVESGRGALSVRYRVYAFERSVRTSHVSSQHAFLSPPTLFVYLAERRDAPCSLAVAAPRGWKVACGLEERGGRFHARDYDELVDSPIECGRLREVGFTVADTPFRVVVCGSGNVETGALRRDLARVARAEHDLFGSFPFARYLTIVNLSPAGRGGLEHRASTALEWPRFGFHERGKYEDFLALFAHELFHAWNVKAVRPRAFHPYDYLREQPTRLLWWFEGVTDYYDELLLRRAGLLTPRAYLDRLIGRQEKVAAMPGRLRTSLAQASYDAWIKHYRPDENSANSTISYYEKGHLAGALLDLEIRRQSGNRRSLDDVIRAVVASGRAGGVAEDGIARAIRAATGLDLRPWLARHVEGTAELPFAAGLKSAGIDLERRREAADAGGWLGVTLRSTGGKLTLQSVVAGGPAESGGLSAFDELVAIDGARIDEATLRERLGEQAPGGHVRITYFRDEELGEARVRLGAPPPRYRPVPVKRPSATQLAVLASWIGAKPAEIGEASAPAKATTPRATTARREG